MEEVWGMIAILIALACLSYVLYLNGFFVLSCKTSLLYVESPHLWKKQNAIKATFSACNGTIKRVLCLKEKTRYRFVLSSNTTSGNLCVVI